MSKEVGVVRFGSRERPNSILWWAELGRIHHENKDTGAYGSLSCDEFYERVKAIHELNGRGKTVNGIYDADERLRIQRFVAQAGELLDKAKKEQGDPDDPRVRAARKEARPRSVSMAVTGRPSLILPPSYKRSDPLESILKSMEQAVR